VLVLLSGTAIAQVASILAAPVLTRLYTPAEFGVLGLFTAVLGLVTVVATGRYEFTIQLAETEEEASGLFALSLAVLLAVSALTGVLLLALGSWLAEALDAPALAPVLWWLPLAVLMQGLVQTLNVWLGRRKQFGALSRSRLAQAGVSLPTQMGGGVLGLGTHGMVGGQVAGQAAAAAFLAARGWRLGYGWVPSGVTWSTLRTLARRYADFPRYGVPQTLVAAASQSLPQFALAVLFTPAVVGQYGLAQRMAYLPLALVGTAVRQVFYQRAAEVHAAGGPTDLLLGKTLRMIAVVAGPPALVLALAGPQLFAVVFGAEWREAGEMARWLGLWILADFVSIPAVVLYQLYRRHRRLLAYDVVMLALRGMSIVAGGLLLGSRGAVALFSVVGLLGASYLTWSMVLYCRAAARMQPRQHTA
jgi:lipopolysaccharide exporter